MAKFLTRGTFVCSPSTSSCPVESRLCFSRYWTIPSESGSGWSNWVGSWVSKRHSDWVSSGSSERDAIISDGASADRGFWDGSSWGSNWACVLVGVGRGSLNLIFINVSDRLSACRRLVRLIAIALLLVLIVFWFLAFFAWTVALAVLAWTGGLAFLAWAGGLAFIRRLFWARSLLFRLSDWNEYSGWWGGSDPFSGGWIHWSVCSDKASLSNYGTNLLRAALRSI